MHVRPYNALVVDDDQAVVQVALDSLRRQGYGAVGVSSVSQAKNYLSEHDPHMTFCDYNLGDGTSEDVRKYLKSTGRMTTQMVVMTGYTDFNFEMSRDLAAKGVKEVLLKGNSLVYSLPYLMARFCHPTNFRYESHPIFSDIIYDMTEDTKVETQVFSNLPGSIRVPTHKISSLEKISESDDWYVPAALIFSEKSFPKSLAQAEQLNLYPNSVKILHGKIISQCAVEIMRLYHIAQSNSLEDLDAKLKFELRERQNAVVRSRLSRDPNLYVLYGESGSGKSSVTMALVRALPQLRYLPSFVKGKRPKQTERPGTYHYYSDYIVPEIGADLPYDKTSTHLASAHFNDLTYLWFMDGLLDSLHDGYDVVINTKMPSVVNLIRKKLCSDKTIHAPRLAFMRKSHQQAAAAAQARDGILPTDESSENPDVVSIDKLRNEFYAAIHLDNPTIVEIESKQVYVAAAAKLFLDTIRRDWNTA